MMNAWLESAEIKRFAADERGSVFLEFTIAMMVFLTTLFGIVEFTHLFYEWNVATKAVQRGARLAAVSEPVAQNLITLNGLGGAALPGDPMPAFDFTCSGATASCSEGNYDVAAMNALVYGLNNATCDIDTTDPNPNPGMCDIYDRITPANVTVRYQYTGLGYAGRPGSYGRTGGAVPTITVSLSGLNFNFVFMGDLLGLGPILIPDLRTTITGEDLNVNGDP
jgi:hypothetical protein